MNQTATIKTIQQIKDERQAKLDALMTTCGVFWAFSDAQFYENKTPLKEGDKYVSMGMGGYMPKSNVDSFKNGMNAINKEYKAEIKANKGARRANIAYELSNHECYYTGDITDALKALGPGYTRAEVKKVYNEEREAVEARN